MTATARGLIERAADRLEGTVYDLVRGCALDSTLRIEHNIATTKDAVDPMVSPLSGRMGYHALVDAFDREAVLPRIGAFVAPFSTPFAALTEPPVATWVGGFGAKPVARATLARLELPPTKLAAVTVLTEESLRWSGVDADTAMREILTYAAVTATNSAFLSSAAAVPDESPAGAGFGLSPLATTGDVFEDIIALIDGLDDPVLVASLPYALRIRAATRNAAELRVIVAPEAGSRIFAFDRFAVAVALGAINVDFSEHAAISMVDNPEGPAQLVSMFQSDSRAARVSIFANWEIVRPDGVAVLDMEAS